MKVHRSPYYTCLSLCLALTLIFCILNFPKCEARVLDASDENDDAHTVKNPLEHHHEINSQISGTKLKSPEKIKKKAHQHGPESTLGKSDDQIDSVYTQIDKSREQRLLTEFRIKQRQKEHVRLKRSDSTGHKDTEIPVLKNVKENLKFQEFDLNKHKELNKKPDVDGVRRLDFNVDIENKKTINKLFIPTENNNEAAIPNTKQEIEKSLLKNNPSDNLNSNNDEIITAAIIDDQIMPAKIISHEKVDVKENLPIPPSIPVIPSSELHSSHLDDISIVKEKEEIKVSDPIKERDDSYARLQLFKNQAINLQEKLRDAGFLEKFKEQKSAIFPNFPKLTENQVLNTLKSIVASKNLQDSNDIQFDAAQFKGLNDKQIQIVQCAQKLTPASERQSFTDNLVECIRGLNAVNCLQIFIYPIIAQYAPDSVVQNLPKFPIEVNVGDLILGEREKFQKSSRHLLLLTRTGSDPEAIIHTILTEELSNHPHKYEDLLPLPII